MFKKLIDWFKEEKEPTKEELFWENLIDSLKSEPHIWVTIECEICSDFIHLYNDQRNISLECVYIDDELGSDFNVYTYPGKNFPEDSDSEEFELMEDAPRRYRYKIVEIVYPWIKEYQNNKRNQIYDKFA